MPVPWEALIPFGKYFLYVPSASFKQLAGKTVLTVYLFDQF
jgi:hypothetical protein